MKNTCARCRLSPPSSARPALCLSHSWPGVLNKARRPRRTLPLPSIARRRRPLPLHRTMSPWPRPNPTIRRIPSKSAHATAATRSKSPKGLTGQPLADDLMAQWKRHHPEAHWVAEEKEKHGLKPPADNSDLLKGGQAKGNTYGDVTKADLLIWNRETEKFVAEGSRIFHDAKALGSTVAVSCDMCHPNAANTHPETYPKFQTQLGRVALLRDMINWCIQNPVRGAQVGSRRPHDACLGGVYSGPAQGHAHGLRQALTQGVASDGGRLPCRRAVPRVRPQRSPRC